MLTLAREAIPVGVGEIDYAHPDYDPPTLPDDGSGNVLDGRTIVSATAIPLEGSEAAIEVVGSPTVISSPTTVNGRELAPGTAVRFQYRVLATMSRGDEAIVKVLATLSDGSVKPLGVRFKIDP